MKYIVIRKIIHLFFGISAIALLWWQQEMAPYLLSFGALIFLILDLWRNRKGKWQAIFYRVFGKLLKPAENKRRITAATTFLATVAGLSFSFPNKIVIASILILSISDPLASIAGKLFPIRRIRKEKSITGSTAFLLSAVVIYHFFIPVSFIPILSAALLVTLIELFSPELLENILVGFSAAMVLALMGNS